MSTVRVVVTGATGQVAYALLPRIAAGEMFGPDAEIDLRLADIPPVIEKAKGVLMELQRIRTDTRGGSVSAADEERVV